MAPDDIDEDKEAEISEQVEDDDLNPEDGGVMAGFEEETEDEEDTGDKEYEAAFEEETPGEPEEEEEPEEFDDEF